MGSFALRYRVSAESGIFVDIGGTSHLAVVSFGAFADASEMFVGDVFALETATANSFFFDTFLRIGNGVEVFLVGVSHNAPLLASPHPPFFGLKLLPPHEIIVNVNIVWRIDHGKVVVLLAGSYSCTRFFPRV